MSSGIDKLDGNNSAPVSPNGVTPKAETPPEAEIPVDPFVNAALLFDNSWNNSQSLDLRYQLLAIFFGGAENIPPEYFFFSGRQDDFNPNYFNQTLDSLIILARNHTDFENFRAQPENFWNQVQEMSQIHLIETYVNGNPESRAVSRYGELLERLNRLTEKQPQQFQSGFEQFLTILPPHERDVFQARHQINQTFGANELFVGNGIALDKHGNFPVCVFLTNNGKNPELAPHSVLSLLNGSVSAEEFSLLQNASIFSNGQILFSAKSAALISLSLAIYQNINALLSLEDAAVNSFAPKNSGAANEQLINRMAPQNLAENAKINFRAADAILIAAFISGVLETLENFAKFGRREFNPGIEIDETNAGSDFSAGATGAIMSATIGCTVPLAEKSVGEILGFAASVVVGLTENGLCLLGANVLVSLIKTGVQNILDAGTINETSPETNSPNKRLNAAQSDGIFENDLRQRLFRNRIKTLSTA